MKLKHSFLLIALICAILPYRGSSQARNVLSTHRVFPKMDKGLEFEKALAAHAQKFHKGDNQWHVFDIVSGPDFGGIHIVEGPKSWVSEDTRGNLGDDHNLDWNKNMAIYLTDRQSGGYSVYIDSLSTSPLDDFAEKSNITHVYPKIGQGDNVVSIIKRLRKVWQASGMSVAVYAANSSGKGQYTIVTRYKQGLKEKADDFRAPFKGRYEAANGEGSYNQYLKDVAEYVQDSWSEMIFLRKDLGSK